MKVSQLIKDLKKMPQNLEVLVAAHDNHEWEYSNAPRYAEHFIKKNFDITEEYGNNSEEVQFFKDMPKECVILRS